MHFHNQLVRKSGTSGNRTLKAVRSISVYPSVDSRGSIHPVPFLIPAVQLGFVERHIHSVVVVMSLFSEARLVLVLPLMSGMTLDNLDLMFLLC